MTDVTAALFRTLIERTEKNELEWVEAIEDLYYCDFKDYRIVMKKYHPYYHIRNSDKNREEGRPKVVTTVVHHAPKEDGGGCDSNSEAEGSNRTDLADRKVLQRTEIDSSKHPRYRVLADQLYALIDNGGGPLEVPEQDLIENLVNALKG